MTCKREGKWFGRGCKFEPRYDTEPSRLSIERSQGYSADDLQKLAEKYQKRTYAYDVCIRCGKTIQRNEA